MSAPGRNAGLTTNAESSWSFDGLGLTSSPRVDGCQPLPQSRHRKAVGGSRTHNLAASSAAALPVELRLRVRAELGEPDSLLPVRQGSVVWPLARFPWASLFLMATSTQGRACDVGYSQRPPLDLNQHHPDTSRVRCRYARGPNAGCFGCPAQPALTQVAGANPTTQGEARHASRSGFVAGNGRIGVHHCLINLRQGQGQLA